jgi:hypothetical protein
VADGVTWWNVVAFGEEAAELTNGRRHFDAKRRLYVLASRRPVDRLVAALLDEITRLSRCEPARDPGSLPRPSASF